MKATINSTLISQLKPKEKPYEVRDDKITGFLVRVNISGKLLYMCEYSRGKRVSIGKVGLLTPTQARDKALTILGDTAKGLDPREEKQKKQILTLRQFLDTEYGPWVCEHRKTGKHTLQHIKYCFLEAFGNKPLTQIIPAVVDQWRTQRLKDGLAIESVNRNIAILKAALSKAALWNLIDSNPLEKLKLLRSDRSVKVRFLSNDEEIRLRTAAIARDEIIKLERMNANKWRSDRGYELFQDLNKYEYADHLRPMILLSINTGLRRGEIFSLKWNNINFNRSILTIEGTFSKSGKTRHLPLNSEAKNVLHKWKVQCDSNDYVFPNKIGGRFDNVHKSWQSLLKAAEINNFRWHDMRHHFASKLVMANVDLNTVRELLGHSDIAMTLRYAHLAPEHKANAVEKLVTASLST